MSVFKEYFLPFLIALLFTYSILGLLAGIVLAVKRLI